METHENLAYETSSVYTTATKLVVDEDDCTYSIQSLTGESIQLTGRRSSELAEHLSMQAAQQLGIDPVGVHLFALQSADGEWISPGKTVYSDAKSVLSLRLRFFCNIFLLAKDSHKAMEYLYLQVRRDFIEGRIREFASNADSEAIVKGLAVLDMVCAMKEQTLTAEEVCRNWKNYLPRDVIDKKPSKKNVTDLLHNSYRKNVSTKKMQEEVEKRWREALKSPVYALKDDYMKFLIRYVHSYFCQEFQCRLGMNPNSDFEVIRINPSQSMRCRPHEHADIAVERRVDKDEWKVYFRLHDVHDISLMVDKGMCQLHRMAGIPLHLQFMQRVQLESFVTLIDGYRRFTGKFYFNVCSPLSSPYLQELKANRLHAPCDKEATFHKLLNKEPGTFTLAQLPTRHAAYRLDVVHKDATLRSLIINAEIMGGSCNYSLSASNRTFQSIPALLHHYSTNDTPEMPRLGNCIRPQEDDKFALKLFIEYSEEKYKAGDGHGCSSKGFVLEETIIYPQQQKSAPMTGEHSTVKRAVLHSKHSPEIVIKVLNADSVSPVQQLQFLAHIRQFASPNNTSTLVKYYGILGVSPLSVVLEYMPLFDLRCFLDTHHALVSLRNLMDMACQMAAALCALEVEHCYTGPVMAKRVFVAEFSGGKVRVKLGPQGLGDVIHWTGSLQSTSCQQENSWDFGTFLWELFTFGAMPLVSVLPSAAEVLYQNGYRLEKPQVCPQSVYQIMEMCWCADENGRPGRSELMREMNQGQAATYHEDTPLKPNGSPDPCLLSKDDSFLLRVTGNCLNHDLKMHQDAHCSTYDPWMIEESALKMVSRLGEGRYGEVNLAQYTDPISDAPPRMVAVKQLKSVKYDRSQMAQRVLEEMRDEMEIMKSLQHAHIVEIVGMCVDPLPLLVMEYCQHGALSAYLRTHKNDISIRQLTGFGRDVAEGMSYLQSREIVHRDLASRNILVQSDMRVVISDFGLARFLDTEGYYLTQNYGRDVPLAWYAPEVIVMHKYSSKSDVWSFGVLMYEIYSYGESPYFCQLSRLASELEAGKRLNQPKVCPDDVYALMSQCWQYNPECRPHFKQLDTAITALLTFMTD